MAFDPASLTYDANGLIPCITQDAISREVLMFAWMNAQSLSLTLRTGRMTYWSRSRAALWIKGETSGHVQTLIEMRFDCDRDCLLALIRQEGAACHTNRRTCFFTAIQQAEEVELMSPMA